MQIKNQISLIRYLVLTIINFGITSYYFGEGNYLILLVCFASYLVNQLFLVIALHKLIFTEPDERENILIFSLFISKLIILAAGIWYGTTYFVGNKLIIIGNYIFQLIILTLSIKRLGKKIKE